MRPLPSALAPFFGLLAVIAPIAAQKGLPEPRAGLSFQPPKGWLELAGGEDRGATLRLFAAPRALASAGAGTHTPVLRVMWFAKGGDASKDVIENLPRTTPFRSFDDFCNRGFASREISATPNKVGGVEGRRIVREIDGGTVLIGQTLPQADGEAALCVQVLANQADKLKKDIDAALGSIEAMPRVAGADQAPPWRSDSGWAEKDSAARRAARRTWAEGLAAAAAKAPPVGFKVSKSKYWTVISATDAGFTKKATVAAEAARDLFAKQFPDLTKEPPLPAVLRIFDSVDMLAASQIARADSREYDQNRRELLVVNDRDNGGPGGYGPILRAVLWQVLDDIDEGCLPAIPRWFDNGLWEFLRSSSFDGKKFEFAPGDVEKGRIDYYRQNNQEMPAVWALIQGNVQISPTDGSMEKDWGYTPECARLIRWLWLYDGQKAFDKPTLLADYVRALGLAWQKKGPDPTAVIATAGLSDAQKKERNTRFYTFRDAMLVEINNIAAPLTIEQWDAMNLKWLAFNKGFK